MFRGPSAEFTGANDLAAQIEAAFPLRPIPPVEVVVPDGCTYAIEVDCLHAELQGTTWRDFLEQGIYVGRYILMSAIGFDYYLPGYLLAVTDPNRAEIEISDLLKALDPERHAAGFEERTRVLQANRKHVVVVVGVLRFIERWAPDKRVAASRLAAYWESTLA